MQPLLKAARSTNQQLPPPPPKPLPRALELAQLAMAHQMPTVLAALLDTWQAAGAADTYLRHLALAPLALVARHARHVLLASIFVVSSIW
jgi:hypothetical protein